MVSQTQVLERSGPLPTAQSVSSRHSHGRRHRPGRSHHGGSSYQAQNDFPIFTQTGDVEIVIHANGQENRYLLHRLILAQCSGFFQASMSEEWSRGPVAGPSKPDGVLWRISEDDSLSGGSTLVQSENGSILQTPVKKRWRFELDWENKAEDEEPILVQRPPSSPIVLGNDIPSPSSMTKPSAPQAGFFRSISHLAGIQSALNLPSATESERVDMDPLIRDYDNLFRLFYNYPPVLNSVNIASAYTECKSLLALADMYDALSVTGPRVDHHLLGFGSRLFKQIAKYPPSYLKLGYLARSRVIFTEALIHVVGQWPTALPHLRNGSYTPVPTSVLDLIEDKVEDLEDLKARVESKLFRLTLTTSRGERVNPNNAYLDWLAVSLFRQWLVDSTTPPPAPILKSSNNTNSASHSSRSPRAPSQRSQASGSLTLGTPPTTVSSSVPVPPASIYRLIGSPSTQAYLPHDELKRFLKVHPTSSSDCLYTRDVLKRFERKMDEIKRLAREIVKPLLRNFLELDLKGGELGSYRIGDAVINGPPYLTCTRVKDEDLPWD